MVEDLEQLLSALNVHNVRYVVVGGYAIAVHAQPRATKDLDVFIDSKPDNAKLSTRPSPPMALHSPASIL